MGKDISLTTLCTYTITGITALVLLACVRSAPSHAAPRLTIEKGGRIAVNGTATVPFGFYHVSWISDTNGKPRLGKELAEDIHTMGIHGAALVQYNIDNHRSIDLSFSAALPFNMLVIGELQHGWWNPGDVQRNAISTISGVRNHPSLIGWNICDDINWRDAARALPIAPSALRARRDLIKRYSPDQLTYASGVALDLHHDAAIRPMGDYQNTTDILGFTSYTLGTESGIPEEQALEQTVRNYRALEEAFAGTDQALFAVPQLFRFQNNPEPTITEVRNGVYAALMHGVDGILGYAFYTGHSSVRVLLPQTNPSLFRDLSDLAREIGFLTPWLTTGVRSHLTPTTRSIYATTWRLDDRELLLVLSTDRFQTLSTDLPLPLNGGDTYELVPERTAGFRQEKLTRDDSHSLTFLPGQVRLFIRTRPPHPQTLAPVNSSSSANG